MQIIKSGVDMNIDPKLKEILDYLTKKFSPSNVIVYSGYRSPEHNKSCGGAPNSQHIYGKALDIAIEGVPFFLVASELYKMFPAVGGYGFNWAGNTLHFDIGPKRWWAYDRQGKAL